MEAEPTRSPAGDGVDTVVRRAPRTPHRDVRDRHGLAQWWRHLTDGLAFASPALWCLLLDADDRLTGHLSRLRRPEGLPDGAYVDHVVLAVRDLTDDIAVGAGAAFLLCRSGKPQVTGLDLAWAAELLRSTADHGVRTWPVHVLAGDVVRVAVPGDPDA